MKLPLDKITHVIAGYVVAMTVGIFATPWVGLVAGVVAGGLKELIYDRALGKGTPDGRDFWATAAGALIGFAITLTTKLL